MVWKEKSSTKRSLSKLHCDMIKIKMNLRTSTVKQRTTTGLRSLLTGGEKLCNIGHIASLPMNEKCHGSATVISIVDERKDLNDNIIDTDEASIYDPFITDKHGQVANNHDQIHDAVRSHSDIIIPDGNLLKMSTTTTDIEYSSRVSLNKQQNFRDIYDKLNRSSMHTTRIQTTNTRKRRHHAADDCQTKESHVFSEMTDPDCIYKHTVGYNQLSPSFQLDFCPSKRRSLSQPNKLVCLGESKEGGPICNKHMPWFGIDVGGTLIKVVFFDPKAATPEEMVTLKRIHKYLKSSKAYGSTGKRDTHLEMTNCLMNGREGSLHFIRFATCQMASFLNLAKNKKLAATIDTVCATGGGAYKFEEDIRSNLGIRLNKTDELDSIIYGIHYIDKYNPDRECYFLEDPLDDAKCVKVPYDFSRPYPYLVVNIGSGVSILAVYSSTSYSRISGSSIGGGTFLGLCSLLTQCETFDEAIQLAEAGSSSKIDKLVKDIYGGDYPKFNLSGNTVASSFGHMNQSDKRKDVTREDLARALLEMITINIGSIARMCAARENIDRVVFIGNFLRVNELSMKLLSYAVNYWSKGAIKALFLEHEGYFGAVGCFVESTRGSNCYLRE